VERLADQHRVHRGVRKRDLLGAALARVGCGVAVSQLGQHRRVRVHGDDPSARQQRGRELARAGAEVEQLRPRPAIQRLQGPVDGVLRVAGPVSGVGRSGGAEGAST
jgi:hypothetical protein